MQREGTWRRFVSVLILTSLVVVGAVLGLRRNDDVRALLDFWREVPVTRTRICACRPDTLVSYDRPDGLRLEASVFRSRVARPRGTVVLLHGNTRRGSHHPLYRVVADRLAERGFLTVAPDLAGFGGSDDPLPIGRLAALDPMLDARATIDVVGDLASDPAPIHSLGHSRGGVPALEVALKEDRVVSGAALGPSRSILARLRDPVQLERFWSREVERRRELYGEEMPRWYDVEDFLRLRLRNDLDSLPLSDPASDDTVPLLIIEGAREPSEDLAFTRSFLEREGDRFEHVVLSEADHYANVLRTTSRFCVYDGKVISALISRLERWFDRAAAGRIPTAASSSAAPRPGAPARSPPFPTGPGLGPGSTPPLDGPRPDA